MGKGLKSGGIIHEKGKINSLTGLIAQLSGAKCPAQKAELVSSAERRDEDSPPLQVPGSIDIQKPVRETDDWR